MNAATVKWTEGAREFVADTKRFHEENNLTTGGEMGFVGNVGADDNVVLHGRLDGTDWDDYRFTASSNFSIDFIFGGVDLRNGGRLDETGLVDRYAPVDTAMTFTLTNVTENHEQVITLMSDITSGPTRILMGDAGDYVLGLTRGHNPAHKRDVQYDLNFAFTSDAFDFPPDDVLPMPVPAGGALLIAALGGLALTRRKKA